MAKKRSPTANPVKSQLDTDLGRIRRGLRRAGIPTKLVSAVSTRALRAPRRKTGKVKTNREPRWSLDENYRDYGTEEDCKKIEIKLLGTLLEFKGAPAVDSQTQALIEQYLGRSLDPNSYRDALTLERIAYAEVAAEVAAATAGRSGIHIGHRDPAATPRHTPDNVEWRSHRSNMIQGDLTLTEARTRFVELIARYFNLGEVKIEPD